MSYDQQSSLSPFWESHFRKRTRFAEVEDSEVAEVEEVSEVVAEAVTGAVVLVVVAWPDQVLGEVEVLNAHSGHPKVLDPLRGLVVQGWPIVVELASLGEVEQVNWDGVETRIRTLARSLHGMVEGRAGT